VALQGPERQPHGDEDDVDQRRGRLVEVVDVLGDELAQLVDEEAEAEASEHRGDLARGPGDEGDRDHYRDHHQQPAPKHVRDVQAMAAELRVVGQVELQPDNQDHRHRADQEGVEQLADLDAARGKPGKPDHLLASPRSLAAGPVGATRTDG
jgi:hypothetical protein